MAVALTVAGGNATAEPRLEYQPAIGLPQTVSPGSVMLRTVSMSHFKRAKTLGDFSDAFGLIRSKMTVPDGTKLEKTARGYCTANPVYSYGPVCFLGTDAGAFDRWQMYVGVGSYRLHTPLKYQTLGTGERTEDAGAVYTITYLGVSGGTVRVSYREFNDGLARPAFTEDLTFDKPTKFPTTIALKGYKIAVDGIDNSGFTYRVLSNP